MKKIIRFPIYKILLAGCLCVVINSCREDETTEPFQISSYYTTIAACGGHSLALGQDGTLWAWGKNECGQSGMALQQQEILLCRYGITKVEKNRTKTSERLLINNDNDVLCNSLNFVLEENKIFKNLRQQFKP